MTAALYRRYRPETFGEMIGQAQVTEPLMTALRTDRVGHAYLFSGPRGCGKTTSARILARCLNCAEGPTDVPCGVCASCVELGRGGSGSLDVVEIDAASHNGVDDARDLRERAIFAPARDRFKIFILDEAHMVTPQGFNALLKLVEEPPDHVKFIFATTEPEKVIGTIRSRTHHYPFRLVAPAAMLTYVEELCGQEGVEVEPGVLPLVVRAGGGSPRDTLSLLDQLIAGSDPGESGGVVVRYDRAVALLGYTPAELLDAVVDAFAAGDAGAAFGAVDRVVQTGQDPRRFVDDLLERLRDLIVIAATGAGAAAVLRGVPADELERMSRQAEAFGSERLSRTADIVVGALDEMTGATSPRLQLELMIARVLARGGAGPAVERTPQARDTPAPPAAPRPDAPPPRPAGGGADSSSGPRSAPIVRDEPTQPESPQPEPPQAEAASIPAGPVTIERMREAWPQVLTRVEAISRPSWLVVLAANLAALDDDVLTLTFRSPADLGKFKQRVDGAGPSEDLRTAIQGALGIRVKYIARLEADGPNGGGSAPAPAPDGPGRGGEDTPPAPGSPRETAGGVPATPAAASAPRASAPSASAPVTDWAVAPIPSDVATDAAAAPVAQLAVDDEPEDAASAGSRIATIAPARDGDVLPAAEVEPSVEPDEDEWAAEALPTDEPEYIPPAPRVEVAVRDDGVQRYGEAVVRQVLGATFVREEPYQQATRFN